MTPAFSPAHPGLAALRALATQLADHRIMPFGAEALDTRLASGGLRAGALHEATALTCSLVDDAAATLFLVGIAAREARAAAAPVLWVSCRNDLYAPGLEQAGLASADVIHAQPRDDAALLAVVEDAVRDGTPAAVVAEASKVSMVATRRLQLAAAEADIPVLLLRRHRGLDRDPLSDTSAAWTRWRISSVSSERLGVVGGGVGAGAGVGRPRWLVELARQRGGEGFSLIVEGCDATGRLAVPAVSGHRTAKTAGSVRRAAA